jgi:hypothetical protein
MSMYGFDKVEVWNDGDLDFTEAMNDGRVITIPSKKFIVMNRHDAAMLCGKWVNPVKKVGGEMKEVNFKRLRRVPVPLTKPPDVAKFKNTCIACGKICDTEAIKLDHIKAAHPDLMPRSEVTDDPIRTRDAGKE